MVSVAIQVTFIVPVGSYHTDLLARSLASIEAQTIPAAAIVIHDTARRGDFLTFLDADDEVLPTFVEATLAAYRPGKWVYTDWLDGSGAGETPVSAPRCPWMPGTRNVITTLLKTVDVQAVGGFDETMDGLEDSDLYLRLLQSGVCGLKVPEPLFRYNKEGDGSHSRSSAFYGSPGFHAVMARFQDTYRELQMTGSNSSCDGCGGGENHGPRGWHESSPYGQMNADGVAGEKQLDDVVAQATWQGNRKTRGVATGRLYPRIGWGRRAWVDPRDVDAMPHLWQRIEVAQATPITPNTVQSQLPRTVIVLDTAEPPEPPIAHAVLEGVQAVGQRLFRPIASPPPPPRDTTPKAPSNAAKPNAKKARELYRGNANG
jgi:hypothetical protein